MEESDHPQDESVSTEAEKLAIAIDAFRRIVNLQHEGSEVPGGYTEAYSFCIDLAESTLEALTD